MSEMFRPFAVVLLLLAATVANAQPRLVFDHKIGVNRPLDSPRWMSFVAISSDSQTVAGDSIVSFGDGSLGFWSFPNGKLVRSIDGFPVAISPDFRYLVLQKQILDLLSGKPILTVAHKQDTLDAATFSADSELMAVKASPHLVKGSQLSILRTAGGSVVSSFGTRFICAMAFAPDGHTIATGHWNNITLWDVQTGERLAVLMSPPRKVDPERYWRDGRYLGAIAVSPDGKLIAAGSDDGELQVWKVATRELLRTSSLSWAGVSAVAFSPDSSLIATGSYHDGTLRLVDTATGKVLSEIQVSMFGVGAVAFSPDGRYLVTPSNAGMLNNWKYSRGGSIRVYRIEK
jgi:WD40 repeat protein